MDVIHWECLSVDTLALPFPFPFCGGEGGEDNDEHSESAVKKSKNLLLSENQRPMPRSWRW